MRPSGSLEGLRKGSIGFRGLSKEHLLDSAASMLAIWRIKALGEMMQVVRH